jgi:hypothetical protein
VLQGHPDRLSDIFSSLTAAAGALLEYSGCSQDLRRPSRYARRQFSTGDAMPVWTIRLLLLACLFVSFGSQTHALTVDAGPDKVLAFPAKDLTLFGRVVPPGTGPSTIRWTQKSGPAPVVFSAPHALTTTATFSALGIYVFRLAASDSDSAATDTMTVTVTPASSQVAFYVDPSFAGVGQGTAESPWSNFTETNPDYDQQWSAINAALATSPVIVYFSARRADADTPEEILGSVHVWRTNTSTHRLTLDGMSRYNTNDVDPSWSDYTGASKMRINVTSGCCFSIGWYDVPNGDPKMDYVTLRGFEVTGDGGRITWGGSYSVLEYIWSHDVTGLGATVQFDAAVSDYPYCQDTGKARDITVRNNLIERGAGEGIYISGNYVLTSDGGCPDYGNTHSDILIEGNTVRHPGFNGNQGDAIDLKAGLMNVTIRNNLLHDTHPVDSQSDGITALGVFPPARTEYLIEGNHIFNAGHGITMGLQNGTVIRNNVIYNCRGGGIYPSGDFGYTNANLEIYNNTIYNTKGGIGLGYAEDVKLRNNLIVDSENQIEGYFSKNIDSDYNLLAPLGSTLPEGEHSIVLESTAGITANPAAGDFRLVATSPARDRGIDLAPAGFDLDFQGVTRPQGHTWDIGALEFRPTAANDPLPSILTFGRMAIVSWPLPAEGWVLEETPALNSRPAQWTQVTFPYVTNAMRISVLVSITNGNRFFRLRYR